MKDREAPARSNSIRVLREANRYLVYQCVMKEGPLSVERLIRLTGLSRPTVLHLLRDLMDSEIIVKDGFADSATVGRSASLLNLNRQNHFALGIDFEFPAIRMAIANMKNDILAEESFLFPENIGPVMRWVTIRNGKGALYAVKLLLEEGFVSICDKLTEETPFQAFG
jgi:hypothetical protein